jgi:hypothetical protein
VDFVNKIISVLVWGLVAIAAGVLFFLSPFGYEAPEKPAVEQTITINGEEFVMDSPDSEFVGEGV